MLDLSNQAALREVVQRAYGLEVGDIASLPIGADADSAAYRMEAIGQGPLFLKTRPLTAFNPASLLVPSHLARHGVSQALAPMPTRDGAAWVEVGGLAVSVWPFVEGRQAADGGLSEAQWVEFGAAVRRVHEAPEPLTPWPSPSREVGTRKPEGRGEPPSSLVPVERFVPSRWDVMARLEAVLSTPADPVAEELAQVWRAKRDVIQTLVERVEKLGAQLRQGSGERVLCHADLHLWNVMVDPDGRLWLVDWDETTPALKERDLMFVIGGIGHGLVEPRQTAWFLQGYGEADFDPDALAYYRAAWAVQDIAAYGEQVCLTPGLAEDTRRGELAGFASLFATGNIVEIALRLVS